MRDYIKCFTEVYHYNIYCVIAVQCISPVIITVERVRACRTFRQKAMLFKCDNIVRQSEI